jgi:hypothetical protein
MGLCAVLCPVDALRGSAIVGLGRCGGNGAEQLYSRRGIPHSALPVDGSMPLSVGCAELWNLPRIDILRRRGSGRGKGGGLGRLFRLLPSESVMLRLDGYGTMG